MLRTGSGPVVVLLLALASTACERPQGSAPPPAKVRVAQPLERAIVEWDEYTARLDAIDSVEVRPRVSGYLQATHFEDGSLVKKGDLLFSIDPRPYEATLQSAEAALELAQSRLDLARKNLVRAGNLLKSHAISQEEGDIRESTVHQAEAQVAEARAALEAARLEVEFTQVTAPIGGRVGRELVTEGNLINGGSGSQATLLTTIVSLDPIYAYFDADERAYLKYARLAHAGTRPSSREHHNPVWIGLADEEGFPHLGEMDFVDNQLDRGTGTIIGRARLPNPDLLLAPGLFARLRLLGSGKYAAIQIPDEAVGSDQAQKFVWVVGSDNKVEYRRITTGPLVDGLRVVRDGLSTSDWVIVEGTQRARPGALVDPQRQQIPAPVAVGGVEEGLEQPPPLAGQTDR